MSDIAVKKTQEKAFFFEKKKQKTFVNWTVLKGIRISVVVPLLIIGTMLVWALVPAWVAPFLPTDMDGDAILAPPSLQHWLGTDQFGRDVYTLLIYGAQQSLEIAICAVAIASAIGTAIGLISGFAGGRTDMALMRLVDVWLSVPPMLLALIIAAALGGGFLSIVAAIASMTLPSFSRIIRAQVIAVKARPFVTASRALGGSSFWVMRKHVLPHTLSQLLVLSTLNVGNAVVIGAALSFIGLGVIDDRPDWGYLLSESRGYLTVAWWFATAPGLALTALVVSVNLLGDALKGRLDPRSKRR